jgi:1,2-diacylglycerol 3-alpha-glucosyltransferase
MKILISSESFPPVISGVAIFTSGLTDFLCKQGHQVTVFTAGPDFKKTKITHRGKPHIYSFRSLPNPFRKHFRFTLPQKKVIKEAFDKEKPDLVHLQDPGPLALAISSRAEKLGLPIIATHHFTLGLEKFYLPVLRESFGRGLKEYLKFFYKKADLVVCPSYFCRKELEVIIPRKKCLVIPNGADFETFHPAPQKKSKTPLALYVGRIDPEKEIGVLLEAAEKILKKEKIKFIFAGPGKLFDSFREQVEEEGLEDSVFFIGPAKGRKLIDLYQKAWFFWTASRVESQGIVILEALASGLPVIASRAGGIPEMVADGENGFLVGEQNPDDYAEKALTIINDSKLRERLSKNAIPSVRKFDQKKMFGKYVSLYEKLLKA